MLNYSQSQLVGVLLEISHY